MTLEDIQRIDALIQEAAKLPAELLASADSVSATEQVSQLKSAQQRIKDAHNLADEAEACLSALFGSDSRYVEKLVSLKFDESLLENRGKAAKANRTWSSKIKTLRGCLAKAMIEAQEKARMRSRNSSWKEFLRSGAARAILLGAVVSLVAAFFSKDTLTKWFAGMRWNEVGAAFPNFEVVEHERIVDLTKWTRTPKGDTTSQTGEATFLSNLKLRKIREEGTEFCLTAASSGSDPLFTSSTHQISQHPIDMQLVNWPKLKQAIAVLRIPAETKINAIFDANINSIRYRSFSDEQREWCSNGVWNPTRKLIMIVKFPPGKMGRDFVFGTAFFHDGKNLTPLTPDKSHCEITADSVKWTVDHPILGNAYRIDWSW